MNRAVLTLLTALTLTGCIAGAGLDPSWVRSKARNFPRKVGTGVSVINGPREFRHDQIVGNVLCNFPHRGYLDDGEEHRYKDLWFSFKDRRILVRRDEKTVIDVQLPSAFYMHKLQVAVDVVAGRRVVLLLNSTRASTGLYYLGVYRDDGSLYFEATLTSGEVWNMSRTGRGIMIQGAGSRTEIVLPQPD